VSEWLRDLFRGRPAWMNVIMVFCGFMTFVYMPWDIFWKPVAIDQEVWFGVLFTGWTAKVLAVPHWFVYGAGAYGLRRNRPWVLTWGAVYIGQVAIGMFLWSALEIGGLLGPFLGLIAAAPFSALTWFVWQSRGHFDANGRLGLRERYGEWALVTGASAGLGAEFARALGRQGISCVLTARRAERLEELAGELAGLGVETRVVPLDLARAGAVDELLAAVRDLPIAILINNAGFGGVGRFERQDAAMLREMIELNCVAPVALTSGLLGPMRERGRGAVLFTGSVAGRQPLPLHAVYSATKAFDLHLGEALWRELHESGVDVLVVEPGSTETEFQGVAGELPHEGASAGSVVESALMALGRQPSVVPGWMDWLRANIAVRLGSRPMVLHVAQGLMAARTPPDQR